MATLQLSNYLSVVRRRTDQTEERLSTLAHSLAYQQSKTTLYSELVDRAADGLQWKDLSSFDDDLPTEAIAEPLEYLGLRDLLEPNRNHPTLFRVIEPVLPVDVLRPMERKRIEAAMRAAAQSMMAAGRQELAAVDITAGHSALNA